MQYRVKNYANILSVIELFNHGMHCLNTLLMPHQRMHTKADSMNTGNNKLAFKAKLLSPSTLQVQV